LHARLRLSNLINKLSVFSGWWPAKRIKDDDLGVSFRRRVFRPANKQMVFRGGEIRSDFFATEQIKMAASKEIY